MQNFKDVSNTCCMPGLAAGRTSLSVRAGQTAFHFVHFIYANSADKLTGQPIY